MNTSSMIKNMGFKWVETFLIQFIQLVISIILARLLVPEDYGTIAIASTMVSILTSVVQSSFNTPLVQKKDLSDIDASSSFYVMLFISIVLYTLLFFFAPLIARIYNMSDLRRIIRVLSLVLVIGAWNSVQLAYIYRNFRFRQSMIINIFAVIIQGSTGILLAFAGYGVWSLVFSALANTLFTAVCYPICNRWVPKLCFSLNCVRNLWKVGLPLLGAELLTITSSNINPMIIGLRFSGSELGAYQKGYSIPSTLINGSISACNVVFLPAMSKIQDEIGKLKELLKNGVRLVCFIVVPVSLGLCAVSEDFILIFLGKQWHEAIIYMQLSCIIFSLYPLRLKTQVIKALGYGKHILLINIFYTSFSFSLLIISVFVSVPAVLISMLVSEIFYIVCVSFYLKRDINYCLWQQFIDILPIYITSALMCFIVLVLGGLLGFVSIFSLIIKTLSGIAVYAILSFLMQRKNTDLFLLQLKNIFK